MIASLITGNVTLVKPAEQTSGISYFIFKLLLKAGLPKEAAALVLGKGENIGPIVFLQRGCKTLYLQGL